jgi:hypothetical protein
MRYLHILVCVVAIEIVVGTGRPSAIFAKTMEAGDASTSWIGTGEIYDLPEGGRVISAVVQGVVIVRHFQGETRGTVHTAKLVCPVRAVIDVKDEQRSLRGLCTIIAHGKDVAYAEWACDGGKNECEGQFTFTGGTGAFSGASGSTPFYNRMVFEKLEAGKARGVGYASWPNFTMTLP